MPAHDQVTRVWRHPDGHREKCQYLMELVGRVGIEPTTN
jgi:hypothetical protein